MKPTRIIAEPTITARVGGGKPYLRIKTDQGYFSVTTLADAVEVTPACLYKRLAKIGWQHPQMLQAEPVNKGNIEFAGLSNKPRDHNLRRLPELTAWDRRCCRRDI